MQNITDNLNKNQYQAVTAKPSNLLVLAGAGSGKTRVLVHRIAWLLRNDHVSPHGILAVTFTNKAAKEIQNRIEKLIQISSKSLWIGTFHGLAHRLLRIHWQMAGLPQTFQICDSDDQLRIIKRIHKDMNLDDTHFSPKQSQYFINNKKDNGIRFNHLSKPKDYAEKHLQEVYRIYEKQTNQLGLIDFAEILLRSKELLMNNPDLLAHYQNRFKHILVDEFQDTNTLQYQWLKLLHKDNYFFMVGDDDQSIYGWRGAKVENIQKFGNDYPGTEIVRLEQNYRSTANILQAANSLISNNSERLGKNLWTSDAAGEPITLYHAMNDIAEARYVVEEVKNLARAGIALSEMAVLYRANHQSRQFEENLLHSNIPYKIYGGQRFFERAEIKDALAYLRLVGNLLDDAALDRVVNWPTRGIGKQSIDIIREYAAEHGLTLWFAMQAVVQNKLLKNRALTSVCDFINLINSFISWGKSLSLSNLMDHIISSSGLRELYTKEDKSKEKSRVENLDELVTACAVFEQEYLQNTTVAENMTVVQAFLSHAVLESGEMQADEFEDSLNLMTIHTAKGLEFKAVFLVGLEEGLFPHEMCMHDPVQLSEERRLCYVGLTRAMQKLYLSFCQSRRMRGEDRYNLPSRFLQEIPSELIKSEQVLTKIDRRYEDKSDYRSDYRSSSSYQSYKTDYKMMQPSCRPKQSIPNPDAMYQLGQQVKHQIFGVGTVINLEESGERTRVHVKFSNQHGSKWLVAKIAKLEII